VPYFSDALEDRRSAPRDPETDFLSHLLSSEKDGQPLSDEEILNICQVLAMAGPRDDGRAARLHVPAPRHPPCLTASGSSTTPRSSTRPSRNSCGCTPRPPGPKSHRGHGLPRLPHAEGRHGDAPDPGCETAPRRSWTIRPRSTSTARRLGTSRSASARTAARLHLARRELVPDRQRGRTAHSRVLGRHDEPLVERGGQLGIEHLPLTEHVADDGSVPPVPRSRSNMATTENPVAIIGVGYTSCPGCPRSQRPTSPSQPVGLAAEDGGDRL